MVTISIERGSSCHFQKKLDALSPLQPFDPLRSEHPIIASKVGELYDVQLSSIARRAGLELMKLITTEFNNIMLLFDFACLKNDFIKFLFGLDKKKR